VGEPQGSVISGALPLLLRAFLKALYALLDFVYDLAYGGKVGLA
jgi:hypothetical protein